ncbi:MAG: hypothetical protein ACYTKD_32385 [Planctomycetota bacterium]|jgi:hypothetical protein
MAAKKKPEHECELCRTLGDIVSELEPEKYQCGAELEVAEAIQAALRNHAKRVGPVGRLALRAES